ncbi:MAG: phosphoglucosamine mutase [Chitinophagia bacterium]|jgi:phosphomannomutase
MALIKSISGIRGTIGGTPGQSLSPLDVVRFTAAFGTWLINKGSARKMVVGRDGRISGELVQQLVMQTLISLGIDVIDLGWSTTPTVEMAVVNHQSGGGIIITASHNPREWNALKLLNHKGEFINAADGAEVLAIAASESYTFANIDELGSIHKDDNAIQQHIQSILAYPLVDLSAIQAANFKIVVDVVNSTGAISVPPLLMALGVAKENIEILHGEVTGKFAHNPEPLPENLTALSVEVKKKGAHLGIAVDPDVDRLCFVCEDGSFFGEEYTLVAVADYILSRRKGNTVSNLSSTRALKDITLQHGGSYFASAVGEVNVVEKMKANNAVIGGEGNGGIIIPDFHYGRDALIGIALFLSHLAREQKTIRQLRNTYPDYFMSKNKIELKEGFSIQHIYQDLQEKYRKYPINTEDGLKIDFENDWVHLRSSNTEPIIRIYAESNLEASAANIAHKIMLDINESFKKLG